jgi:acetylserotonin N-methyltransferase
VTENANDTSPEPILELIVAFQASKTMFAAVKLGIFEALEAGPKSLVSLSEVIKFQSEGDAPCKSLKGDNPAPLAVNPGALEQLLDACVGLGLLRYDGGRYQNSPVSTKYLCSGSPFQMTGYNNFSNDILWYIWGDLESAIQEGSHRWKKTYGWNPPYWDSIFKTPDTTREFMMGMHGYGQMTSAKVVNAFDLSPYTKLVDLGGGTGHLVLAACERYPNLKAEVFELPAVIPLAREVIAESGVADRVEVSEGNFFRDPLPDGDLYVLARILHDWKESDIRDLLKRIFEKLPRGGTLLIAEKFLWEDKSGPIWLQLQSLLLLLIAEGKERTLSEYKTLLEDAKFRVLEGKVIDKSPLDVLCAVKPDQC